MDESTFDRLARAISSGCSRRRLLGVLTGLGLGGVLGVLETNDAGAERPKDHLRRRTKQHRRKRRNEQRRNQGQPGNAQNNTGGGLGGRPCVPINVAGDCPESGNCGCPGGPFIPCVNGKCVLADPGDTCGPQTCPDGCCDDSGACQTTATECTGGEPCANC